jgi:hypothetical protein
VSRLGGGGIEEHNTVRLGGFRHRLAGLPKKSDVLRHCLQHELLSLTVCGPCRDYPGQVGGVGRVSGLVVAFKTTT